jgi:hypothetical protein
VASPGAANRESGTRLERLRSSVRERTRTFVQRLKFAGWLLLAAGVGYGAAAIPAHLKLQNHKRAAAEERRALESSIAETQRFARVLEARRATHRSLLALDERNFGLAETFAHEAGTRLSDPQQVGDGYVEISRALSGFRPLVSDDVQAQRSELLRLLKQHDLRLDASRPAETATAQSAGAAASQSPD